MRNAAHRAYTWGKARQCYWCGVRVHYATRGHKSFVNDDTQATREHVVPRSEGGRGSYDNVVVACKGCNNRRGTADWVPFHERHGAERGSVAVR